PDGLEWAGEAEVFPPTVKVEGPRDVVNSMRTVRSMEIDVSALGVGVIQREIPLVGAPANTTFESPSVIVTLRVRPRMVERVLSPLRVDAEGAVPRSLRPRAVTARIRGPQSVVDELNPASVLAIINLGEVEPKEGNIRVPVELRGLPDGVEVIEVEPGEVTVELEES
ncbi:MAG: CdaR family protein, partial [Deltaproteobacteria bacterium]|nr:CdaR family protein [Deltaproteobacteria bacterium]